MSVERDVHEGLVLVSTLKQRPTPDLSARVQDVGLPKSALPLDLRPVGPPGGGVRLDQSARLESVDRTGDGDACTLDGLGYDAVVNEGVVEVDEHCCGSSH